MQTDAALKPSDIQQLYNLFPGLSGNGSAGSAAEPPCSLTLSVPWVTTDTTLQELCRFQALRILRINTQHTLQTEALRPPGLPLLQELSLPFLDDWGTYLQDWLTTLPSLKVLRVVSPQHPFSSASLEVITIRDIEAACCYIPSISDFPCLKAVHIESIKMCSMSMGAYAAKAQLESIVRSLLRLPLKPTPHVTRFELYDLIDYDVEEDISVADILDTLLPLRTVFSVIKDVHIYNMEVMPGVLPMLAGLYPAARSIHISRGIRVATAPYNSDQESGDLLFVARNMVHLEEISFDNCLQFYVPDLLAAMMAARELNKPRFVITISPATNVRDEQAHAWQELVAQWHMCMKVKGDEGRFQILFSDV